MFTDGEIHTGCCDKKQNKNITGKFYVNDLPTYRDVGKLIKRNIPPYWNCCSATAARNNSLLTLGTQRSLK
jgi:hypothetical protein